MLNVLPTVNIILALKSLSYFKRKTFTQQQVLVILVILVVPTLATIGLNFYNNHLTTKYFKWAITYSLFSGSLVSIGYLFYTYASYEKKQVIQARELEYSRLNELKTKAELEALHAKINPHFLYNALNSIADLTITDGRKAREMTVALSELFRYTINYSNSNFSTIKEEIEMAETYLRIEKIRFEENLTYKIHVADDALYAKIPKFILQPIIENAVKHGLSALEKNGEVKIDVSLQNEDLVIKVYDNGRKFKSDFSAGFGYKNIIEKLKILHPGGYQLEFINNPDKHVMLILNTISKPLQND
jgi:LytS/YehU family sensor histidine kinase